MPTRTVTTSEALKASPARVVPMSFAVWNGTRGIAQADRDFLVRLAAPGNTCYSGPALRPGANLATMPGQIATALAYWSYYQQTFGVTLSAAQAAVVADAVTYLTTLQTFVQTPGSPAPPSR